MKKRRRVRFLRAITFSVLAFVALVVLMTGSAFAITGNWVNDYEHPYVGLVVIYDSNGDFLWRGSGSLISPTVVLTAGHITDTAEGAASARVYFQQDAGAHYDADLGYDPVTGYPDFGVDDGKLSATSHHLYNYGFADFAGFPNTHDAGIIVLDYPIPTSAVSEYGQLPTAGLLDSLATKRGLEKQVFTVSGYGLTLSVQEHSALSNISYRSRLMAQEMLVNLRSHNTDGFNIQTQGNGNGRGGTCSGDSGGPVFLGGSSSNLIVAVTSFGMNSICRGTDFAYRIDTTDVLAWINGFLVD
jgi:Trypsin